MRLFNIGSRLFFYKDTDMDPYLYPTMLRFPGVSNPKSLNTRSSLAVSIRSARTVWYDQVMRNGLSRWLVFMRYLCGHYFDRFALLEHQARRLAMPLAIGRLNFSAAAAQLRQDPSNSLIISAQIRLTCLTEEALLSTTHQCGQLALGSYVWILK